MMRESAVGIARVSSKDQEDGYSLASQDKLISTYSDNHDFRLLKVFKIAETASKAKQRRIFREAMKFVAGDEGFEPPMPGPEPGALPLGQSPMCVTW